MGVKGLQTFMDTCCPEACVTVKLREMAKNHAVSLGAPTLVVDGMACLRIWYSCKDWVCGGQWNEYLDILRNWVEVFTFAGISLVFFFDGVVEEQKRQSWVKRRRRVNSDVCKVFSHIKLNGEQPVGAMSVLPSGLSTFTSFALKSLGQKVFCSVREADFEIANYARENKCLGILGQDTDFIIYDSVPYLSAAKLKTDTLTTVLYDRQRLCNALGLAVYHLPLLACLLGNDVVSEERMQHVRSNALTAYRPLNSLPHPGAQQGLMIFAVSQFVRPWSGIDKDVLFPTLKLSPADRGLLEKGIRSYKLSGQNTHLPNDISGHPAGVFQKYVSPAILKACREKHVAAEGFMVYSVVSEGVVDCSNSLEDKEDTELLPQALVYKPCRQRIYGLLLQKNGSDANLPAIKEWFVYPENSLKEADITTPVLLNLQCDRPTLDTLWFSEDPEVSSLRLLCFLAILDCQDLFDLHGTIEEHIFTTVCLVTYIVTQVKTLSQEDVDAYLSQALCLAQNSSQDLQEIKLPFLCSRAVQLGCLFVRGLSCLLGANCASGGPLLTEALMPWNSYDGRLFHSKYLLAHSGVDDTVLLDNDASSLTVFHHVRDKLKEVCLKKGRVLQSRPRRHTLQFSHQTRGEPHRRQHTDTQYWTNQPDSQSSHHSAEGWRGKGEMWRQQPYYDRARNDTGHYSGDRGHHHHGNRGQLPYGDRRHERGNYRSTAQHSDFYPQQPQPHNRGAPTNRRGRFNQKARFHLAPRWSQPPTQ